MERVTSATDCPCTQCKEPILKGAAAAWVAGEGFYHPTCIPETDPRPEVENVVRQIVGSGVEECIVCGEGILDGEWVAWVNHVDSRNNGLAHEQCCREDWDEDFREDKEEHMAVTTYGDLQKAIIKAMPGLTEDDFRDHTVGLAEDTFLTLNEAVREDTKGVLLFVHCEATEVSEHFITKASQVEPFLTLHVIPRLHRAWATHTAALEHLERVLSLCVNNSDPVPAPLDMSISDKP